MRSRQGAGHARRQETMHSSSAGVEVTGRHYTSCMQEACRRAQSCFLQCQHQQLQCCRPTLCQPHLGCGPSRAARALPLAPQTAARLRSPHQTQTGLQDRRQAETRGWVAGDLQVRGGWHTTRHQAACCRTGLQRHSSKGGADGPSAALCRKYSIHYQTPLQQSVKHATADCCCPAAPALSVCAGASAAPLFMPLSMAATSASKSALPFTSISTCCASAAAWPVGGAKPEGAAAAMPAPAADGWTVGLPLPSPCCCGGGACRWSRCCSSSDDGCRCPCCSCPCWLGSASAGPSMACQLLAAGAASVAAATPGLRRHALTPGPPPPAAPRRCSDAEGLVGHAGGRTA